MGEHDAAPDTSLDYRFSLANERTFLAWIRTSLALNAGGLAVHQLLPPLGVRGGRELLAGILVVLGTVAAVTAVARWRAYERAMLAGHRLPSSHMPLVLSIGVGIASVGAVLLLILEAV